MEKSVVAEDAMYIALEDQTGYLKLFPTEAPGNQGDIKWKSMPANRVNDAMT